jgi:hypothetical protein
VPLVEIARRLDLTPRALQCLHRLAGLPLWTIAPHRYVGDWGRNRAVGAIEARWLTRSARNRPLVLDQPATASPENGTSQLA